MPGIMIQRPKMTRTMYQSLKRQIMKERERKKQEQEQDEELAKQRREREIKKKKEQEDSRSLELNKENVVKQIVQNEKKIESLKNEKHELFSHLKKVLHQEDESRKRAQMKENEMVQHIQQQYHPVFLQGPGHITTQTKYMNVNMHRSPYGPAKRPRSPSPTPQSSVYGAFPPNKYQAAVFSSGVGKEGYPNPKSSAYAVPSTQVTYATPSGKIYQTSQHSGAAAAAAAANMYPAGQPTPPQSSGQSATQGKYPSAGQSAFSSYPSHFAAQQQQQQQQQQQIKEHFQNSAGVPTGFRMQQMPTQQGRGFITSGNSNIPLQQQLQHADKKSGFAEDKYKLQAASRSMARMQPHHQQAATQSRASQQTPKGGITSGFPVRTQVSSASYQQTSQAVSSSQQHPYAHQGWGQIL